MLRIGTVLVLIAFAITPALAAAPQEEVLLGLATDYDKGELTIHVVSTGCTKKADFRLEFKDGVLKVLRVTPDYCKAMPEKIALVFTLRDLGIGANTAFRLANKLVANPNLAKL